jgi:hypothetical protein
MDDLAEKVRRWHEEHPVTFPKQYHCKNCGGPLQFYTNWTGSITDRYTECPYCHAAITGYEDVGTV